MKLIGKGFLNLVDHVFWHLPFSSVKQAHAVREKANPPVSEEDWAARFEAITDEHKEEGAREQLAAGWKAWLVARNPAAAAAAPAGGAARPGLHRPGGLTSWRIRFSDES